MRNTLILALFLFVSLAWAAAQQQDPASPSGGAAQSPRTTMNDSGQQTSPNSQPSTAPESSQMPSAATSTVTEGCLGGTDPNFTITDKAGVIYSLNVPQGTDVSVLSKHVGESVQVAGAVNNGGASSAAGASRNASGKSSIDVKRIGRGTGTCPGSSNGAKPPAK